MSGIDETSRVTQPSGRSARRSGVVAVITRGDEFLVIRRSQFVRAPGAFCFPGGGRELGESEPEALRRELLEELAVEARIVRRLWASRTASGLRLAWWRAELTEGCLVVPNPAEVESIHWFTASVLQEQPHLLPTNREFLAALERREFSLD
jgi:8-oxo-dGTP pyrophosphatase MutT (NUDIX family)